MYVYITSEPGLHTVGFYKPDGSYEPESDHMTEEEAVKRVHYLNGGRGEEGECERRECSYYTHYLVHHDRDVNGPQLVHEAFHQAEKNCDGAQKRVIAWYDAHMEDGEHTPLPEALERQAKFWEKKVCA